MHRFRIATIAAALALNFLAESALAERTVAENLGTLVKAALPAQLHGIQPGTTTRTEVEKRLGKPLKDSTPTERFYQLTKTGANTNDLTIGLDAKGRVRYSYYQLPTTPAQGLHPFKSFLPHLPKNAIEAAQAKASKEPRTHESGRTFDLVLPEKGLLLKFDQSSEPTLRAILHWKPGEKIP